jgi:ABC transporter transmembrane region
MLTVDIAQPAPRSAGPLEGIFRRFRIKILMAYALFLVENLMQLVQPWMMGTAINDWLAGSSRGLGLLLAVQFGLLASCVARRMYDTRAFVAIYADLAVRFVEDQRGKGTPISRIAARSALSRHLVDFFERDIPVVCQVVISLVGSLAMLSSYDTVLGATCFLALAPFAALGVRYGRFASRLTRRIHDQLEREVNVLQDGSAAEVADHYRSLGTRRVEAADREARFFAAIEFGALVFVGFAFVRFDVLSAMQAGTLAGILGYLTTLFFAVRNSFLLIDQSSRLWDVTTRLTGE